MNRAIELSKYDATFRKSRNLPFHRWYPYLEGFGERFVEEIIGEYADSSSYLIDPFAGCGTALLVSSQRGLNSGYFEINPFLRLVIEAKVNVPIRLLEKGITIQKELGKFIEYCKELEALDLPLTEPPPLFIDKPYFERIWRQEGLKVPTNQSKKRRLWLNDGSCIRLRPERKDHVWSYDIVLVRTTDGRALRILVIIDEFTRECLSLYAARRIRSQDVLDQLYDLFISRGVPEHIRSDNGPEFTTKAVRMWLAELRVTTLFIEPASPWENGYVESFNGKLRDELLNGEIFDALLEARVLLEQWRREYNCYRPHSSLGYKPPAPEAFRPNILSLKVLH